LACLDAVSIFSREDPFMSFLPAYDSSAATISLSDTIVRLRRAEALEVARQEAEADPLPTWAPVGQSAAAEGVDAMLRKNWERLARLREAQVARVRKGLAQAEEDESATGTCPPSSTGFKSLPEALISIASNFQRMSLPRRSRT
jgi:hypothetical protein